MFRSALILRSDQASQDNPENFGSRNVFLIAALSSTVLVLYDYLLTFAGEVDLVWRKKFSAVSVLFLLMRYCVPASKVLVMADLLSGVTDGENTRISEAYLTLTLLGGLAIYAFNILRMYALWGKDWRIAFLVAIVGYGVPLTGLFLWMHNTIWIPGYAILPSSLAVQILMIILTMAKTMGTSSSASGISTQQRLSQLFLQNGLIYFIVLALFDTLSLAALYTYTAFGHFFYGWVQFLDAMEVILLTRFILNLRSFDLPKSLVPGEHLSQIDESAWSSHLIFVTRMKPVDFMGNIGSPLDHGEESEGNGEENEVSWKDNCSHTHESAVEGVGSRQTV